MRVRLILLILSLLLIYPLQVFSTEELAEKSGKDCQYCHLDPAGGGELTVNGKGYLLGLQGPVVSGDTGTQAKTPSTWNHLFKLSIGYLHFLVGIFWFGTILYVHLILKPAYASKGLPKGEVKLGLVSIVLMAITGVILTFYRIPSVEMLFTTRFGILLLIKIGLFLVMGLSAFYVVFFIGPKLKKKVNVAQPIGPEMTEEDLSYFDGNEGRRAYFGYRGKIYDATDSNLWKNGNHMARHNAGMDLTSVLSQAPHGEDKIFAMPIVANFFDRGNPSIGFDYKKVFLYMAYMNLINVFLIIFILALWKWL